jgi:hypothetical protein
VGRHLVGVWVGLGVLLLAGSAGAHPLAPSLLELRERGDGLVDVRFKAAILQARGAVHSPRLPPDCEPVGEASEVREGTGIVVSYRVDCGASGLTGRSIGLDGLEAGVTNALVRVVSADGVVRQALLSANAPVFTVPEDPSTLAVARSYTALGIEHLVFGFDHVLFVLGLLMLIANVRTLLATVTAFTVGHSVTLVLASLGIVRFPTALVEIAIAASLFVLAMEIPSHLVDRNDEGERPGLFQRRPWLIAFAFGLLHGLGFAGALAEIGLPPKDIPLALFTFNVGIELGQLALVVAAVALFRVAIALTVPMRSPGLRVAAITGIGSLAGYWLIERTMSWMSGPV